ncbi:hypothetical protein P175DRAFT_0499086 [Aspergillus ochraceoroseus IBT 24754]|uniref:Uncharacterized protein n=3 Tax=Aspergillus subgen. Nidulantes TaxID=2720870 RepID=A0A0F8U296_9EURO|nr:uncharacterized protein P175DRAFT_0499086 [Aspergillus ochraceoroseus IBT 24754]KKK13678.1 hypothetical protein ARAM_006028 [Aspergillus rambellii]KKK24674.1 hypothetical protein AOCH_004908 [Aspergillus ochraceoroseus]PTU22557.1 hypothetical protein P175DRAFT_0499086 [Aspergillus ochraceoroseus IBT 24754]
MDYLPESISSIIQHPTIQQLASSPIASNLAHLHATYLDPSLTRLQTTYLDPSLAHLRSTYVDPYVVQPTATLLASMPDLVSVLVLLVVLLLSLKILDYARRMVMFWVSLVMRLLWWASIISLGLYVYQAGLEKSAQDLGWVLGVLKAFVDRFWTCMEPPATEGNGYTQKFWRNS